MIDKLEFLLALAREQHFGRAAEACGVTQPTLSAGVKQLEDSFGVLLVNRGSRFQDFTPEGERVLDWARRIVGDSRAMREEVHALKHGLTGRLRIAAIPMALAMIETLTTLYHERHPGVQFTVLSYNSTEIFRLLENLEIDAGVTYLDGEPIGRVTGVPLYRERYRLLDLHRRAARRPRQGDVGGSGASPALPVDARHPDAADHRRPAARRRRRSQNLARIGFDDRALLPRPHRTLGERHAGAARCDTRPHRCAARDSDRGAGSKPHHRPGGAGRGSR